MSDTDEAETLKILAKLDENHGHLEQRRSVHEKQTRRRLRTMMMVIAMFFLLTERFHGRRAF